MPRSVQVMDASIAEAKRTMREEIAKRTSALPRSDRDRASAKIVDHIAGTQAFARARTVMGFWPLADEPDVRILLEQALAKGKRVCLPRVHGPDVEIVVVWDLRFEGAKASLGVWEPTGGKVIPPAEVDLVIAPGVAFDHRGGRLGRGKGFFDRLLRARPAGWMVCGVCFGVGVVDEVPREAHDALVDAVATEGGVSPVFPESAPLWATRQAGR